MNLTGFFEMFTNPAGASAVLFDYALKGSLILTLALALTGLLRKASASTRHLILSVAFVGLLLLPGTALLLPSWEMGIVPDFNSPPVPQSGVNEEPGFDERYSAGLVADTKQTHVPTAENSDDGNSPNTSGMAESGGSVATLTTDQLPNQSDESFISLASLNSAISFFGTYWPNLLFFTWLTVSAALFLWVIAGIAQIAWISFSSQQLFDSRWQSTLQSAYRSLGIRSNVRLAMSDRISYPMVWGIIHMTIVLPREAHDWDTEKLRIVLMHELAHVKRRDNLVQMLAHLLLPIFWFNPLAWMAVHRLQREQETACDDLVLRAGVKPSDYALGLMEIAGMLKVSVSWAAAAMARNKKIKGRIMSILNPDTNRKTSSRIIALFVCIGAAIVLMPVASAHIWQDTSTLKLPSTKISAPLLEEKFSESGSKESTHEIPDSSLPAKTETTGKTQEYRLSREEDLDLESLIAQLKSSDPMERAHAAFLIGMMDSKARKAIPNLVAMLSDDTEIYINFTYRSEDRHSTWKGDYTPGRMAGYALGSIGKAAFDGVVPVLKSGNDHARENAVRALRYMRDERALEHVGPLITDKNPKIREYVIRMMREMRSPKNVQYLKKVVTDKNEEVQTLAVRALREIRTPEATKAVFPALKAEKKEVRTLAVRTLRENMSKETAGELTKMLSDPNKEIRILSIRALREFRDPATVAAIIPFLKDESKEVRVLAVRTLRENKIPESVEPLTQALKDSDKDVQILALYALREMRAVEAVPALVELLSDKDDSVRELAVRTLREMKDERAIPALSEFHADPKPSIRELALRALREQKKASSLDAYLLFLKDEKSSIRILAIRAIMELGDSRAQDHLIKVLNEDPNKEVRRMAARAIGELE